MILSGVILIFFLILIFYFYPNLTLNTNINGTLFAIVIGSIVTIIGTLLKVFFDTLDYEKKKNEKKLEEIMNNAEKYYYPIATAAFDASIQIFQTLSDKSYIQTPKLIVEKFSNLEKKFSNQALPLELIATIFNVVVPILEEKYSLDLLCNCN